MSEKTTASARSLSSFAFDIEAPRWIVQDIRSALEPYCQVSSIRQGPESGSLDASINPKAAAVAVALVTAVVNLGTAGINVATALTNHANTAVTRAASESNPQKEKILIRDSRSGNVILEIEDVTTTETVLNALNSAATRSGS